MKRLLFLLFIIPTIIFAHPKPFVGVSVKELPDSLSRLYGKGILVDSVIKNSPAYKVKLKAGDILISLDENPIDSILEFKTLIEKCEPYQHIKMGVINKGKKYFVNLELDKIDEKIYLGIIILKDKDKLLISEIVKESPAEKGGLLIGDEIISIDNQKVTNPKQISEILDKKGYDKEISIKVIRQNKEIKKTIFLFRWNSNLLKESFHKMDEEFMKDMRQIFPILDER